MFAASAGENRPLRLIELPGTDPIDAFSGSFVSQLVEL
jgi:hypothetical protein